jgi:hypothetical protein
VLVAIMMVTAVTLIFTFTLSNGSNRQETRVQSGQERKEVEKPIRTVTEKAQQRNFQAAQHTPHQMRKTPVYLAKEQQSRILEDKDIKPRDPDVRSRDQDSTLHRLRDHALKVNMEEKVLNLEKLADENGDTLQLDKHGVVLAVQVHNRSEYFAHFVASLKFVKNIEQVLLVVSHDYYSPEIESLVASITVCKVSLNCDYKVSMVYVARSNQICTLSSHTHFGGCQTGDVIKFQPPRLCSYFTFFIINVQCNVPTLYRYSTMHFPTVL